MMAGSVGHDTGEGQPMFSLFLVVLWSQPKCVCCPVNPLHANQFLYLRELDRCKHVESVSTTPGLLCP